MRKLTHDETEIIRAALEVRTNYIETGNVSWDGAMLSRLEDRPSLPHGTEIKSLDVDQMKLIIASKGLVNKILQGKLFIED